ncbi:hypothetical protein ACU686_12850 [Yinghuangia aomiensis]
MIGGRILDTSAIAAAARGNLYMRALLTVAHERLIPLVVPTTALSDAAAELDDRGRHALTAITQFPLVTLAPLTEADAVGSGVLRAHHGPGVETTAGHVAYLAAARQWPVVTAVPGQLRVLYPDVEVEALP